MERDVSEIGGAEANARWSDHGTIGFVEVVRERWRPRDDWVAGRGRWNHGVAGKSGSESLGEASAPSGHGYHGLYSVGAGDVTGIGDWGVSCSCWAVSVSRRSWGRGVGALV